MTGKSIFGDVLGNSIAGNGRKWVEPAKPVVPEVNRSERPRDWRDLFTDEVVPASVPAGTGNRLMQYAQAADDDFAAPYMEMAQQSSREQERQNVQSVATKNRAAQQAAREAAFANDLGDRILNKPLGDLPSQLRHGVAGLTKRGIAQLQDMVTPVPTLSAAQPFRDSSPMRPNESIAGYLMRSKPSDISTSENARMVWKNSTAGQLSDAAAPASLALTGPGVVVSGLTGLIPIVDGGLDIQQGRYSQGAGKMTVGALTASPFAVKAAPYAANGARWAWEQASPTLGRLAEEAAFRSNVMAYAVPPKFGTGSTSSVDLSLKYKAGWSETQRAEANAKVQLLSDTPTVVTESNRSGTAASMNRYRRTEQVTTGRDIDHKIDLQLGGGKGTDNLWSLDYSVNRSLGSQIQHQIKHLPPGTVINKVTIGD